MVLVFAFFLWRMVRPLNIFVLDERFEKPMELATPEGPLTLSARECGGCHEDIYREWAESMHAQAWSEPYFQVDFKFDGAQQICLNCHTPLKNQQENLVLGFRDREKFKPLLEGNPTYDPALREGESPARPAMCGTGRSSALLNPQRLPIRWRLIRRWLQESAPARGVTSLRTEDGMFFIGFHPAAQ